MSEVRELLAILLLGGIGAYALFLIPSTQDAGTASALAQLVIGITGGLIGYIGGRYSTQQAQAQSKEGKSE